MLFQKLAFLEKKIAEQKYYFSPWIPKIKTTAWLTDSMVLVAGEGLWVGMDPTPTPSSNGVPPPTQPLSYTHSEDPAPRCVHYAQLTAAASFRIKKEKSKRSRPKVVLLLWESL